MSMIRVGSVVGSRYKLLEQLHGSDHTLVFRAFDESTRTEQLLKFFNSSFFSAQRDRDTFYEQSAKAQLFSSPGLCRVFGAGEYLEFCYLVLEPLRGALTLRMLLNRHRHTGTHFGAREVKHVALGLLEVLETNSAFFSYCKPEHIYFQDGRLRLAPFNMLNLTRFQSLCALDYDDLPYVPANLAQGRRDGSSLVFSLGSIWFEMLTGKIPDHDFFAFAEKEGLYGTYRELLQRALATYPENRFSSLHDLDEALRKLPPAGRGNPPSLEPPGEQDEVAFPYTGVHYRAKSIFSERPSFTFSAAAKVPLRTGESFDLDDGFSEVDEKTVITTPDQLKENLDLIKRAQRSTKERSAYYLTLLGLGSVVLFTFLGYFLYQLLSSGLREKENQVVKKLGEIEYQRDQLKEEVRRIEALKQHALRQGNGSTEQDIKAQADVSPADARVVAPNDPVEEENLGEAVEALLQDVPREEVPAEVAVSGDDQTGEEPEPPRGASPWGSEPALAASARSGGAALPSSRCPPGMSMLIGEVGCIDQFEFPNVEGELPINMVTIEESMKFCSIRGKRLCKLGEWRLACSGEEGRAHPYGERWEDRRCNIRKTQGDPGALVRSASYQRCATPDGVADLAGNLGEWVMDDENHALVVGGSFQDAFFKGKCEFSEAMDPHQKYEHIGFRCCKDLTANP